MDEVLIDGDKRIPGIAVTFLLIFKHSYLSLSTAFYITSLFEMVESEVLNKSKHIG